MYYCLSNVEEQIMVLCKFGSMYLPESSILKILTFPTDDANLKKVELHLINGEKYDCGKFDDLHFHAFKAAIMSHGDVMANDPILI